jgi:predicted secreted Zn-dependent protease
MKHEHALAMIATLSKKTSAKARSALLAASPANFAGHWKNQMNSTMDLTVSGNSVTGSYTSVDANGNQTTGSLIGAINGHVICFIVNWSLPAITTWAGHLVVENAQPFIETLWHLPIEMSDPDDANNLWESVYAGADRFFR